MCMSAIHIDQLSKRFEETQALQEVSLQIEQGEYFGLLGPNGAGKSTLISIIAGLTRASSGRASVMGFDVQNQYRQARRAVGIVPQELVFDPFFTVRNMLRLQASYFGLGKSSYPWIDELIERLELSDKADARLRQLSGGMKRRVLIAQALVHNPPVIILDEPTAGVDVELRQTLWQLTRDLQQQGKTIVLTTHYLEEAEALCDRIAILNKGQIQALEKKEALMARQHNRYLTVSLDQSDITSEKIPDQIKAHIESVEGNALTVRISEQTLSIIDVIDCLRDHNIPFSDLQTSNPSLEDIFLDIVGQKVVDNAAYKTSQENV